MEAAIQKFADDHSGSFHEGEEEHTLDQTRLHESFKTMFERLMEGFVVARLGISVERFFGLISRDLANTNFESGRTCVQMRPVVDIATTTPP